MGGIAVLLAAAAGLSARAHPPGRGLLQPDARDVPRRVRDGRCIGFVDDYIKVRKKRNKGVLWKLKGYITLLCVVRHRRAAAWPSPTWTRGCRSRARRYRAGSSDPVGWVLWAGLDHLRHHERGQRHRRPRRPGRRVGDARRSPRSASSRSSGSATATSIPSHHQPVRPRRVRGGVRGCLRWIPVVERGTGAHLHGRRRRARARARRSRCSRSPPTRSCSCRCIAGLNVIEIGSVALQMVMFKAIEGKATPVPTLTDPPPLRDGRVGRRPP